MKNHLDENKLREILQNKEFEFSDQAWNKFEVLQKESVQPRDNRRYIIILLLLCGFAFLGFWYNNFSNAHNLTTDTRSEVTPNDATVNTEGINTGNTGKLVSTENSTIDLKTNPLNQESRNTDQPINTTLSSTINTTQTIGNPYRTSKAIDSNNAKSNEHSETNTDHFDNETESADKIIQNNSSSGSENPIADYAKNSEIVKVKNQDIFYYIVPIKKIEVNYLKYNRLNIWTYDLPTINRKTPKLDRTLKIYGSSLVGLGNKQNFHTTHTLGIELPMSTRISLETGVGYKWHNVNQLESHRGFSTKYNSFTEQFYHNSIEADRMNLLHVPLILNYKLGKKWIVSTGGYYNFLFLTKGTIIGNKDGELVEHNTWIVEKGIQRNQLGLSLNLRYRLSNSIQLECGFKQNITRSFTVTNSENTRLGDFSLGIKYYLKK